MRAASQLCAAAVIFLAGSNAAHAAPSKLLSYQARVTDANGQPLGDNTYQMRFRIYSTQADCNGDTGANLLYTETHGVGSEKQITNGLFSVVIGNITSITLAFDANYWLGAMVDSDRDGSLADETQFTPCDQLTTSPYAIRSIAADSADVATNANACSADATCETNAVSATGNVTPSANNTYTSGSAALRWSTIFGVAGNFSGNVTMGDASGDSVTVNAGTFNFANAVTTSLANSTSAWNIDANTLVIDATNNRVGIRVASPSYPLHVGGNAVVDQNNVIALGDATNVAMMSSGGAYAHFAYNAYFNGASWLENVDNAVGLLVQLDAVSATKAVRFYYAPAAVGAPAWSQILSVDQNS
ncbi:MAG: hypothetical protein HYY13_00515, partial [Nitrospirae bacterium]|nr:hypothetical protein [Nitrospirota bacterium]